MQGATVTIRLNGRQVVQRTQPADWIGNPNYENRRIGVGGTFAQQGHDPTSIVHFKNIQVKPLP